MPSRAVLCCGLACAIATVQGAGWPPSPALADEENRIALPSPASEAWRHVPLRRIARQTRYTPIEAGFPERPAGIHAESDCSASLLVLRVDDVDLTRTPLLSWRWRVERGLDIEDERARSGDDFPARVYVAFELDPEHASLWQRARARIAEAFYGDALPGTALNYVWTSHLEPGTRWPNPRSPSSHMIALARGPGGEWRRERVDVGADYEASFGHKPPRLRGVGLMSDSDDSCQRSAASFSDFSFSEDRAAGESDSERAN
jgi:hypothetical protein